MDCLFLINSASGGMEGQLISDTLNTDYTGCGHNIQAVFLNRQNPLSQISSLVPGKDLVVIGGGDGTVAMAVSCLAELTSPPPFAILPLGTGNDLARNTGWFKIWQAGGLDAFFTALPLSRAESIDIWDAGGTYRFICYAGIGLDARIVDFIARHRGAIPEFIKWHAVRRCMLRLLYAAGALRYAAADIGSGSPAPVPMEFYRNGVRIKKFTVSSSEMIIIASIDRYGGGGRLWHRARRDDGIFEVYRFSSIGSYLTFLTKSRIGGKFTPEPAFQADALSIPEGTKLQMQCDGEPALLQSGNTENFISLYRAIPVLIPPVDFGARERIRKTISAGKTIEAEVPTAIPGAATIKERALCKNSETHQGQKYSDSKN